VNFELITHSYKLNALQMPLDGFLIVEHQIKIWFMPKKNLRGTRIKTRPDLDFDMSMPLSLYQNLAEISKIIERHIVQILKFRENTEKKNGALEVFTPEFQYRILNTPLVFRNALTVGARFGIDEVIIHGPRDTDWQDESIQEFIRKFITKFYVLKGYETLAIRVNEMALKHNFKVGNISIRANKTRWGSCSGDKNISINPFLLNLDQKFQDYVILHELCHTLEMNHSPKFWAELERVFPGAKIVDKELNRYSATKIEFEKLSLKNQV
jgi:predicted metal-dependent hydrolase